MPFSRLYRLVLLSTLCLTLLLVSVPSVSANSLTNTEKSLQPLTCPKIGGFTPTNGMPGISVTITGCGFTGATGVAFHGVSATFAVNSDTQITATVPNGAITGVIAVTTANNTTVKSSSKFTVLKAPPAVTLSPTVGPPTSSVQVSGTNFGPDEAVDVYFDTTDEALASTNAQGVFEGISIQIPANAVPGTHWVTAIGRRSGLSAQTPFLVQTNWAQFHNIPTRTGVNPYENVLNPANVSDLDVAWSASTGSAINSSPAVVNGVVYVGSEDDNLYAFNAQTGTQLWSAPTGSAIDSSPAVANSVVYAGAENGKLYAFNAQTGIQLWSAPVGSSIVSSPTVVNSVVYIGAAAPGPDDGSLAAFNAQTGALLWSDATGPISFSSPAVANGVVYIGTEDGSLEAFNAQTGSPLLYEGIGSFVDSTPAVADGMVYVGTRNGNLDALNAQSGVYIWSVATGNALKSSPAVANGVVYIGSEDGNLDAFNAQTGSQLWSAATGNGIDSSPMVANGVVYVGSEDGNLYAFNAQTGAQLWFAPTGFAIDYSSPAVANGMVYVGSEDDSLHAYALPPGEQIKPPTRPKLAGLHPNPGLRTRE